MKILVTTTGSYPPILDGKGEVDIESSIKRAIEDQIDAGVDILVDGQVRSDIVGIFAREIGLQGTHLPYSAPNILQKPGKHDALKDLQTAARHSKGRPIKAHLTGPTVIAESCLFLPEDTHSRYLGTQGFRHLVLDIADALAEEASQIGKQAKSLNIQYLQIDEPSLTYGADLGLAVEAIDKIVSAWRNISKGKVILHACGDTGAILSKLLDMPVDIFNVESDTLRTLDQTQASLLIESKKLFALGVLPVNIDQIPTSQRIAREVIYVATRFGEQHVWGLTPACGLRLSTLDKARQRITRLVETARSLRN